MLYEIIHIVHIYSVFIYGGFLIVDNLFLEKMYSNYEAIEAKDRRDEIMVHVKKVVPYALYIAVLSGVYMAVTIFGKIEDNGLSNFQILLALKVFFGLWLGLRGFNQKVLGINPIYFKGHKFPFLTVLFIIFLSQYMYMV